MNIAILGAGGIASVFADTIKGTAGAECYAVASRDIGKAKAFAEKYGFARYYGSYEEMLQDREVELVYIATPHSHHYEHIKLCIDYKKNVLCEKAFTVNSALAREIKELAAKEKIFVAEAIWTRYMPSRTIINDIINSGVIGKIHTMTANLSYVISSKERLIKPELAGGALLDVGIYCLNFAVMHLGKDIVKMDSSVKMTESGVDGQESITLHYADGCMAVLNAGIYGRSDRQGIFYGDKGYIIVDNINNPKNICVYDVNDTLIKKHTVPKQINGYEYELKECMKSVQEGKLESYSMPLDETIYMLDMMDRLRHDWGMKYPME